MDVWARTDRTHACRSCAIRVWPVERCPRCHRSDGLHELGEHPAVPGALELLPGPRLRPWRPRAWIVGRAESIGPLLSAPLSRRGCLAWVLGAELSSGRLLDAQGSRFVVAGEDSCMLVEGDRGGYDLSPSGDVWEGPCPARLPQSLRAFLRDRGVTRAAVAGERLRELVLVPGARVEVSGLPVDEVRTDSGYRGSERITVLHDEPGAPLRVTLLSAR